MLPLGSPAFARLLASAAKAPVAPTLEAETHAALRVEPAALDATRSVRHREAAAGRRTPREYGIEAVNAADGLGPLDAHRSAGGSAPASN